MTHTFATLEISESAFVEIRDKLLAAGYDHVFADGTIDMHGLGLAVADRSTVTEDIEAGFRARLLRLLREKDISQKDFAVMLNMPFPTVNHWATGRNFPRMGALDKIAAALGTTGQYLLFGTGKCA